MKGHDEASIRADLQGYLGRQRGLISPEFSQVVDASFLLGLGFIAGRDEQPDRMLILVEIERLMSSADIGLFDAAGSLQ